VEAGIQPAVEHRHDPPLQDLLVNRVGFQQHRPLLEIGGTETVAGRQFKLLPVAADEPNQGGLCRRELAGLFGNDPKHLFKAERGVDNLRDGDHGSGFLPLLLELGGEARDHEGDQIEKGAADQNVVHRLPHPFLEGKKGAQQGSGDGGPDAAKSRRERTRR